MSGSSRFAVAVHILTLLAGSQEAPFTSEYVAASVNTNAVVIRRVLGALRAARLVTSRGGARGGWQLVGDPAAITLRDVYRAVENDGLFALPQRPPNAGCPVGRHIQQTLAPRFAAAAQAMEAELAHATVADVLREVREHAADHLAVGARH